jgi:diguanylate cyclase (GGDEF)-like protein
LANAHLALQICAKELAEHKRHLEQLNGWFAVALNNMARGLSMFDAEQRLIVCNKTYREMYRLPEELARPGTPLSEMVRFHFERETGRNDPEDWKGQQAWITDHVNEMAGGKSLSYIQRLRDGRTILVSNQPLLDGGWVDLHEDISERRQAEQEITRLARYDPLSDMPNRLYFHEQLETALGRLGSGGGVALHWVDLKGLQGINDARGHPVGDLLLKSVCNRLQNAVRGPDFVGRLGGDEFAIIQSGVTEASKAISFAQRIVRVISEPHQILGTRVDVGVSIGIALAPEHGRRADELLKNADVALYQAKLQGPGAWALYRPAYGREMEARYQIEADLRVAVEACQLELHYQPIVDVKARQVTAFEALMRWRHPTQGLIVPNDFIPLAEKTGLIIGMGAWALQRACRDAMAWPDAIKVAVNLSSLQFEGCDLYGIVNEALVGSGLSASRLELEITETVLLREDAKTHEILRQLCELGVRISFDDFGTAFASLSYLRSFPVHKIKIDRTFVQELPQSTDCSAIIEAIANLAGRLHITTVAEGVETPEQLDAVTGAGCDEIQGFYFSRPVPANCIERTLSSCRAKIATVM